MAKKQDSKKKKAVKAVGKSTNKAVLKILGAKSWRDGLGKILG